MVNNLCDNAETRDAQKYLNLNGRYRVVPNPDKTYRGKCSWFGNFDGINMWDDSSEDNGENASGLPQSVPGIAYMCNKTLKHWWIRRDIHPEHFQLVQIYYFDTSDLTNHNITFGV